MWTLPHEEQNGRHYQYLLGGEAFDWLVLAERLCAEVEDLLPAEAVERLLFHGQLTQRQDTASMEGLLGFPKYRAHLNYWYGVVVEEALQLATEEEARKEQRSRGRADSDQVEDVAWTRLYRDTKANLLSRFRQEKSYPQGESIDLTEMKEFTYWLFKLRVSLWDPARVGSDTRKALDRLAMLHRRDTALP